MRAVTIHTEEILNTLLLQDLYPWAAIIDRVEGGYIVFESVADYETWKNQQ